VPAERIAESLAFINWTVLTGLAIGSFGAVVLGRLRTDATRGYLAFTGIVAVLLGLLAITSDGALPGAAAGSPVAIDGSWDEARRAAMAVFSGLAFAYVVAIMRGRRAPLLAGAGIAAGAAVLGLASIAWGGGALGSVLLLLQLVTLTAALGGVWAAMVLGHWYLVTPKLAEAPLVRFARALSLIVAGQIVLFVAWIGLGAGPGGVPGFGALVGTWRSSSGCGCSSGSYSRSSSAGPRSRPPGPVRWSLRPGSSTSTSARSRPARSSRPGCISAPGCSSRRSR